MARAPPVSRARLVAPGRVRTAAEHSPTLGRGIALGLVHRGPERMGEVIAFRGDGDKSIEARIVETCFYDKAGEKQNA